jgi:phosphoglycolate phosphatase-like HAD superfamily hydrolase
MADPLASWKDGGAKSAIVDFVATVTAAGGTGFVPPAERIATLDNDGTLWLEKPMYIQLQHGIRAIGKMAAERPEVRDRQPFKAVHEKDMAWLGSVAAEYLKGDPGKAMILAGGLAEAFDGMTVDDFFADAMAFLSDTRDERFGIPYKQLTYKPMVELVHYLQASGFQVYIASGGGRDFVRAVSEEIYDIPRSMVIGSDVVIGCVTGPDGITRVIHTKQIEMPIDDGPGKPPHIHRAIGRRPIMAAGNSNGDIEMLEYARGHEGATLALLVRHDDAEREYAYDGGSEKALALAADDGWTVVSMKDDWTTIFDR